MEVIRKGSVSEEDATSAPIFYGGNVSQAAARRTRQERLLQLRPGQLLRRGEEQVPLPHHRPGPLRNQRGRLRRKRVGRGQGRRGRHRVYPVRREALARRSRRPRLHPHFPDRSKQRNDRLRLGRSQPSAPLPMRCGNGSQLRTLVTCSVR